MRYIVLLCLLTTLSGCSQDPVTERLHDYASRVGNAIEFDVELSLADNLPQYPAKRDRIQPVDDIREGLLDVLDLRRCGLLTLIGERNSSLGKLAGHSQRLIYEMRFLPPLRQCIQTLSNQQTPLDESDQQLLQRLTQIEATKRQNLPSIVANAVFATEEIEQQFSLNATAADQATLEAYTHVEPALQRLAHLADLSQRSDWPVPNNIDQLEDSYAQLYRTPFGASWLKSLSYLTQTLDQTADALEQRLEQRPLCFNRKPTPQAQIMRNVFERYYAGQLQPWMSAVHRNGQRWRSHWQTLAETLPLTPQLQDYFSATLLGDTSLWQDYISARDRHTKSWQRMLGHCGMMPSA